MSELPELKSLLTRIDLFDQLTRTATMEEGDRAWMHGDRIVALREDAFNDGLHLSTTGYTIWADALAKHIQ